MKVSKKVIVGGVTALSAASIVGVGLVSAQAANNSSGSLVDKIASTFNLNKADVQKVVDEERAQREADRLAEMSSRLEQLVKDGKITADQKSKIEARQKELQTTRDNNRKDLEKWASDNGIDLKYLHRGMHEGGTGSLDQLVKDGKITADQKSKLEAKQKELESARTAERDALKQWASDNGIDMQYLMGPMGKGGHMRGGGDGPGMM